MLLLNVGRYVTRQPWTIDRSASLSEAHSLMREHDIRHLPVLDNGELVGVLTQHDVYLLATIADFPFQALTVADAMTEHPYVVAADTRLDDVTEEMARHKYSSAIVAGPNGVEGIFTAIDACRAFTDVLRNIAL